MPLSPPSLDASSAGRIDLLCDQFESAWRAGRSPRLEDFIQAADAASRRQLFRALLSVELELRRRESRALGADEYLRRFPDFQEEVNAVFSEEAFRGQASSTREEALTTPYQGLQQAAAEPPPERIGRFRTLALLGEGAFGRVWRAYDPDLEREVAIKVPRLATLGGAFDLERFLREAKAAATIEHPNVCPVHEAGVQDGQPYIVMAYIPGKSLAEALANRPPPPAKQVALIVRRLALALQAAHDKGIVHRDLKPANILFDQRRKDVIVTDFGLARRDGAGDAGHTQSGAIMGTPAYMSPEQARGGSKSVGPAADIFSLGVILYELLAGQRPFAGSAGEVIGKVQHVEPTPPTKVRPEADPRLEAICRKAMAKDPAARFASMRAFADALSDYLKGTAPEPNATSDPATASSETAGFADLIAAALAEQKAETAAAVEAAVAKARIPLWKILLPMGLLAVFGLVMLGLFLFARPAAVTVTLGLDVDLKDKDLSFFLDNQPIEAEKLAGPIELTEGQHVLIVKRGEAILRRYVFDVKRGMDPNPQLKDSLAPPWPMSPGVPPATVHYPLDGAGEALLADARRRASAGRVMGAVQSVPGVIGQAAAFDGAGGQRLEIGDADALHLTGPLFTAACWVKGKSDAGTLLARWGAAGNAFRLRAKEAEGLHPLGDIPAGPSMEPAAPAPMPETEPKREARAPSQASRTPLGPDENRLFALADELAAQAPPTPAGPPATPAGPPATPAGPPATPAQPNGPTPTASPAPVFTNILEFEVNFGAKDNAAAGAVAVRATYDPDAWTHVAATFDGLWLRLYLNGHLAAETALADDPTFRQLMDDGKASLPASFAPSAAPLVIGEGFSGLIDDAMLFDAALMMKELLRLIDFHAPRELAPPPGQWLKLTAEEADLARARLTGKLGEEVKLTGETLGLKDRAEVRFPFRARNFVVRGMIQPAPDAAGAFRLRRAGQDSYGAYWTKDARFGLFKETQGRTADLAAKQSPWQEYVVKVQKDNKWQDEKRMLPKQFAAAAHGDRLVLFIDGQAFLERKDSALAEGGLSLTAMDVGGAQAYNLEVCVLDGTPLTPEQALARDAAKETAKPEFSLFGGLNEVNGKAQFTEVVQVRECFPVQVPQKVQKSIQVGQEIRTVEETVLTTQLHTRIVCKSVFKEFSLEGGRITDARGNPMTFAQAAKRLRPGDACLLLYGGKVAPAYPFLAKAKPDTVVFLPPPPAAMPVMPAPAAVPAAAPIPAPAAMPAKPADNPPPAPAPRPEPKPAAPIELRGHANPIQTVVQSPDGSQLVTADGTFWKPLQRSQLELLNLDSGQTERVLDDGAGSAPMMGGIRDAAFNHDATRFAAFAANRAEAAVMETATGKELFKLAGHRGAVGVVAWSGDGKRLAAGGGFPLFDPKKPPTADEKPVGELKLWDADGKLLFDLKGHQAPVHLAALNRDGSRLVSFDTDGMLRIWDGQAGTEIASQKNPDGVRTSALAFSGGLIALVNFDKLGSCVRLVDAETGEEARTINAVKSKLPTGTESAAVFQSVAFTPDGKRLITCEGENARAVCIVRVFEAATGKELLKVDAETLGGWMAVAHGGRRLVTSGFDAQTKEPTVKVWDAATGKLVKATKSELHILALGPGARHALGTRSVRHLPTYPPLTVKVWNAATGALIRTQEIQGNGIAALAYSGDGKRLAAAVSLLDLTKPQPFVGEVRIWEAASGKELRTIGGIDGWITNLALDAEGKRAMTGTGMATKVWDLESGKELKSFPGGMRMAASRDGARLAVTGMEKTIVYEVGSGQELFALDTRESTEVKRPGQPAYTMLSNANFLAFTPDGASLATAGAGGIRFWSLRTGKEERKLAGNVGHLLFSADGKTLVAANSRATFTLRDAATGVALRRLRLKPPSPDDEAADQQFSMGYGFSYDARGMPMALSPDGKKLATISLDGSAVRLWDAAAMEKAQ